MQFFAYAPFSHLKHLNVYINTATLHEGGLIHIFFSSSCQTTKHIQTIMLLFTIQFKDYVCAVNLATHVHVPSSLREEIKSGIMLITFSLCSKPHTLGCKQ